MSVTNIRPIGDPEYWFVELVEIIHTGVTDPGLVTTTIHTIEHSKNKQEIIDKLKTKTVKLKSDKPIDEIFDEIFDVSLEPRK